MICHLCCILNKILKFETSTSLHSVFIHNLYSVPTFLESGLYIYIYIYINPTTAKFWRRRKKKNRIIGLLHHCFLFLFLPLWHERISSIGSPADDCAGRWSVQVELEDTLCTDVRRHMNTLKHTQTTPLNIKTQTSKTHMSTYAASLLSACVCLCDLSSPRWVKCVFAKRLFFTQTALWLMSFFACSEWFI